MADKTEVVRRCRNTNCSKLVSGKYYISSFARVIIKSVKCNDHITLDLKYYDTEEEAELALIKLKL